MGHFPIEDCHGRFICAHCKKEVGRWSFLSHCDALDTPKPATPEPPEWKGETHVCPFCSAICAVGSFCTCERGQDEMRRWDNIMQAPAQSPLDRALEDFTARRKAKRERVLDDLFHDALRRSVRVVARGVRDGGEGWEIARAMSTPLPHDPDIHTRLMPWKGKEG